MLLDVFSVSRNKQGGVSLICRGGEGRVLVHVPTVYNELIALPWTRSPMDIRRLEEEVDRCILDSISGTSISSNATSGTGNSSEQGRQKPAWVPFKICASAESPGPTISEEAYVFLLPFAHSLEVWKLKSARVLCKRFVSSAEAFVILSGVRGPARIRLSTPPKKSSSSCPECALHTSASMQDIEVLGPASTERGISTAYISAEEKNGAVSAVSILVFADPGLEKESKTQTGPETKRRKQEDPDASILTHPRVSAQHTLITEDYAEGLDKSRLLSGYVHVLKSPDIPQEVCGILARECVHLVVSHGVDMNRILEPGCEWARNMLVCDLSRFIASVRKLDEYSLCEISEAYGVDPRSTSLAGSPEQVSAAFGASGSPLDTSHEPIARINGLRVSTAKMEQVFSRGSLLHLAEKLTQISGCTLNSTFRGHKTDRAEYLILHEMRKRNYFVPGWKKAPKSEGKNTYEGGHVFLKAPGVYAHTLTALFDFNSLYPSIIREFSVCFSTIFQLRQDPEPPLHAALLPAILEHLVATRRIIKQKMTDTRKNGDSEANRDARCSAYAALDIEQSAVKLTANCIYGCLGHPGFRFYNKEMAAYITEKGRAVLKDAKESIEMLGYPVIYGDTDSVVVDTGIAPDTSLSPDFIRRITEHISRKYTHIVLGYEKSFSALVLLAKKKYVGVVISGDSEGGKCARRIEEKGMETSRRDWAPICRRAVSKVVSCLLLSPDAENEILQVLRDLRSEVLAAVCDTGCLSSATAVHSEVSAEKKEPFLLRKRMAKDIQDYTESPGQTPHATLAARLRSEKGITFRAGDIVPYIMAVSNGISRPELVSEPGTVDIQYYIQSQVLPPVQRLLEHYPDISLHKVRSALGLGPGSTAEKKTGISVRSTTRIPGREEKKENPGSDADQRPAHRKRSLPPITTTCCSTVQAVDSKCTKCFLPLPSSLLSASIHAHVLEREVRRLYRLERRCLGCGKTFQCLPMCVSCNSSTEWTRTSPDTIHDVLQDVTDTLSGTNSGSESTEYTTAILRASSYMRIDLDSLLPRSFSLHMYTPYLLSHPGELDKHFLP